MEECRAVNHRYRVEIFSRKERRHYTEYKEEVNELTAQYFGVVLDLKNRDYLATSNYPKRIRKGLTLIIILWSFGE